MVLQMSLLLLFSKCSFDTSEIYPGVALVGVGIVQRWGKSFFCLASGFSTKKCQEFEFTEF